MDKPTYHLEGLIKTKDDFEDFSGPLNLILMLLSKNKIEIRDLKISLILEQYLDYIAKMQEMDLDVASEFVQMASHLVYIKTRTLLVSDEEEVSELDELMTSLEKLKCQDAYIQVKAVTGEFQIKSGLGLMMFSKEGEPLQKLGDQSYKYSHKPMELLLALADVLNKTNAKTLEKEQFSIPKRIVYGVHQKSVELIELLRKFGEQSLLKLYADSESRSEVIATFISVLELCSTGTLGVFEKNGELYLSLLDDNDAQISESYSD